MGAPVDSRILAGVLLALATSVAWALGNVFVQKSGRALGGPRALVWALGLGCLLSALAAVWETRSQPIDRAAIIWVLVAGVSGFSAYSTMFYAFANTKLSLAVPFVTSWSLVASAISLTLLGQSVRTGQLVGAAVVIAGVLCVSIGASRADQAPGVRGGARPLVAALAAGISFGVMVPAMAAANPSFGTFGGAAVVYAIGLAIGIPAARVLGLDLSPPPTSAIGLVIGAGLTETIGFVLLNAAGRFAPVAVVGPVASLASVLTVLYAAAFLRERPGPLALAGALLASVGVVLLAT